jgi:hypothetical protein
VDTWNFHLVSSASLVKPVQLGHPAGRFFVISDMLIGDSRMALNSLSETWQAPL